MERYVTATYRLHELHMGVLGGYVSTTCPKYKLNATCLMIRLQVYQFHINKIQFHSCSFIVF